MALSLSISTAGTIKPGTRNILKKRRAHERECEREEKNERLILLQNG